MCAFPLGDFKIPKKIQKKLENETWLKKELEKGRSAQEILGFTDEVMASFYAAAHHLLERDCYADAINAFFFLATLNSRNFEYWLGLGMAMQASGQFEESIDALEMAAMLEPESPLAFFYLAKSLYSVGERENALEAIEIALECADGKELYREIKFQALKVKELLLRR